MPDFFACSLATYAPFMRDDLEVHTHAGSRKIKASVLLTQPDAQASTIDGGNLYAVAFLLRDWGSSEPLPARGTVCLFGTPPRRLHVETAQTVGGVVHMTAVENANNGV